METARPHPGSGGVGGGKSLPEGWENLPDSELSSEKLPPARAALRRLACLRERRDARSLEENA